MSLPRYPNYKDSGVAWLGEVPGHWEVVPIKQVIALIESGVSVNSTDTPATAEESGVLKTSCVYRGEFDPAENKAVMPEEYGRLACPVTAGTLIVSRMNTPDLVGAAGVVRQSRTDLFLPDRLWQIHFRGADAAYVHYWSNTPSYRAQVEMACAGTSSSMQNLSQESFRCFALSTPPLPEQTQIAAFLDRETAKIDELVAEQRRLMELLKEKRQAVISHAVTRGLNPDAPLKPSGIEWLGEVPAHWEVIALKRIADVQTGMAKGKDYGSRETITVSYLRVANVQDGYLDLETVASMEIPAGDLQRYALKHGDVLMNEGGDFDKLGRGCVWESQIEPCITQNHVFAVRPRLVSSAWLNAITSSDFAQFYFMTRSKQSTNLASISSTNLMELPVVLPPAAEQLEILAFVASKTSSFDTLTTEAQRAIDLLQERRTALISAAVTGQIDVRGAVSV